MSAAAINMSFAVKQEQRFRYFEVGDGEIMVLLHGLFGALSNFADLIRNFATSYKVIVPLLPLYELEADKTTITDMVDYVSEFIRFKKLDKVHLIGNSLGGHIALLYYLKNAEHVKTLTLTGSSGLFENSLGDTYPRKSDKEYVSKKTAATFYDPKYATQELIDEVYEIVNNRERVVRMIRLAKSAIHNNLRDEIPSIKVPVCLIWGKNDIVTPPFVAEEFNRLLPNSELHMIDHCGHAPMMEQPEEFNRILAGFLKREI